MSSFSRERRRNASSTSANGPMRRPAPARSNHHRAASIPPHAVNSQVIRRRGIRGAAEGSRGMAPVAARRPGMRFTRYYCPTAHVTFSLLPDCLASRFPGDLERVVAQVEAAPSIEAAADVLCPDSVLPSAVRWVRRRLTLVRATCLTVVTLLPDLFRGDAHLRAVRARWARTTPWPSRGRVPRRCWRPCRVPFGFGPPRDGAVRAAAAAPTPGSPRLAEDPARSHSRGRGGAIDDEDSATRAPGHRAPRSTRPSRCFTAA
jgi:hypothetical protein